MDNLQKNILFYAILVLFILVTSLTIFAVFTNAFSDISSEHKDILFNAFIVEIGAAIFSLFYSTFKVTQNSDSDKVSKKKSEILSNDNSFVFEEGDFIISINYASDKTLFDFQSAMITSLLNSYGRRIYQIFELKYLESMNWENDFLKRVKALYEGVNAVYAVTLSSISDFWTSDDDKRLIIEYLKTHIGKKIYRLFVFESPYDLAKYSEVLEANYQAYGREGGVFIVSMDYYVTVLVPKFADLDANDRFIKQDFGIWEYDNISILAMLKDLKLSFERVENSETLILKNVNISNFKSIFFTNDERIIKWDNRIKDIGKVAEKLFTEDVTYVGTVTHLVKLKHPEKEVLEQITHSIVRLDDIQRMAIKKGISISFLTEEPWWGRNLQSIGKVRPFIDGKYGGVLHCDNEYEYILIVRLPSIDDLKKWYSLDDHSDIRETVYCQLVKELEDNYRLLKLLDNDLEKADGFSEIERTINKSSYLKRSDFIFNKQINDITPFHLIEEFKESL